MCMAIRLNSSCQAWFWMYYCQLALKWTGLRSCRICPRAICITRTMSCMTPFLCCGLLLLSANVVTDFATWCYAECSYAIRLSVCLQCNFEVRWSHRLEYFKNNFTAISLGHSLSVDSKSWTTSKREHHKILARVGVWFGKSGSCIQITLICQALNCIYWNLQWHHVVSLWQYGFLVYTAISRYVAEQFTSEYIWMQLP